LGVTLATDNVARWPLLSAPGSIGPECSRRPSALATYTFANACLFKLLCGRAPPAAPCTIAWVPADHVRDFGSAGKFAQVHSFFWLGPVPFKSRTETGLVRVYRPSAFQKASGGPAPRGQNRNSLCSFVFFIAGRPTLRFGGPIITTEFERIPVHRVNLARGPSTPSSSPDKEFGLFFGTCTRFKMEKSRVFASFSNPRAKNFPQTTIRLTATICSWRDFPTSWPSDVGKPDNMVD